jgi:uncharacterized protein
MTHKKKQLLVVCPTCKKKSLYDTSNPHRPFCSKACKDNDLINWADENYKIPETKPEKKSEPDK